MKETGSFLQTTHFKNLFILTSICILVALITMFFLNPSLVFFSRTLSTVDSFQGSPQTVKYSYNREPYILCTLPYIISPFDNRGNTIYSPSLEVNFFFSVLKILRTYIIYFWFVFYSFCKVVLV